MTSSLTPILYSFGFLLANILILLAILYLNRRTQLTVNQNRNLDKDVSSDNKLSASDILHWEFEYARVTASEAMRDRHTMINFYLLAFGVLASGVLGIIGSDNNLPNTIGTALLWVLCGIGWIYFLKIIRLRQAWQESAKTMNQIKEFYFQHTKEFDSDVLRGAFRWQSNTLPAQGKPWTVFFFSMVLIGFLDSVAYVIGGLLLNIDAALVSTLFTGALTLFGLLFFAFHIWMYFEFLK